MTNRLTTLVRVLPRPTARPSLFMPYHINAFNFRARRSGDIPEIRGLFHPSFLPCMTRRIFLYLPSLAHFDRARSRRVIRVWVPLRSIYCPLFCPKNIEEYCTRKGSWTTKPITSRAGPPSIFLLSHFLRNLAGNSKNRE